MRIKSLILGLLLILFLAGSVQAAGTVVQSLEFLPNSNEAVLTFEFTADAALATIPDTQTTTEITAALNGYYVFMVITNPGATAPTNLYDIVLEDQDGIDICGGECDDRSSTASEQAIPLLDSTGGVYGARRMNGAMTIKFTNNSVNSATGVVRVLLTR